MEQNGYRWEQYRRQIRRADAKTRAAMEHKPQYYPLTKAETILDDTIFYGILMNPEFDTACALE